MRLNLRRIPAWFILLLDVQSLSNIFAGLITCLRKSWDFIWSELPLWQRAGENVIFSFTL